MVKNYNSEVRRLLDVESKDELKELSNKDSEFIKWDYDLYQKFYRKEIIDIKVSNVVPYYYRPFTKKWIYYDKDIIQRARKYQDIFKNDNLVIYKIRRASCRE